MVLGTIRKVQHAAIEQDRTNILKSHRRSLERRKSGKKGVGIMGGGEERVQGVEEKAERVEKRLEESQERIMGLEA